MKFTNSQLLYTIPLFCYLAYLVFGSGCGGSLIVPEDDRLPSDPRFSGVYIHTLEGDACSPLPDSICETEIMVSHVADSEDDDGILTYHSGIITLYAWQTGNRSYQDWDMLRFTGSVQEYGRATGTLWLTVEIGNSFLQQDYPATVVLEGGEPACPSTLRITTSNGEFELTAERVGPCRFDG